MPRAEAELMGATAPVPSGIRRKLWLDSDHSPKMPAEGGSDLPSHLQYQSTRIYLLYLYMLAFNQQHIKAMGISEEIREGELQKHLSDRELYLKQYLLLG